MRSLILNPTFAVVVCTGILLAVVAAMKWGLHQAEITLGLPLFLVLGVLAMAAILLIAAAVDRRPGATAEDHKSEAREMLRAARAGIGSFLTGWGILLIAPLAAPYAGYWKVRSRPSGTRAQALGAAATAFLLAVFLWIFVGFFPLAIILVALGFREDRTR